MAIRSTNKCILLILLFVQHFDGNRSIRCVYKIIREDDCSFTIHNYLWCYQTVGEQQDLVELATKKINMLGLCFAITPLLSIPF